MKYTVELDDADLGAMVDAVDYLRHRAGMERGDGYGVEADELDADAARLRAIVERARKGKGDAKDRD